MDEGTSYARIPHPDPDALGCADGREAVGATAPSLPIGDWDVPGAVPCDGAIVLRELDRAFRRREIAPWVPLAGVFLVWIVIAAVLLMNGGARALSVAVGVSVFVTWIAHRISRAIDARAGASLLAYRLDEASADRFAAMQAAVQKLAAAGRMWHVSSLGRLLDPGQKYGARRFLRRYRIRPGLSMPSRTLMNLRVPTIYGESRKYFFLPDRVLVYDDRGVRSVAYDRLAPRTSEELVVEDEDVPEDARVVETTWLHVAPDGGPDPGVANNRRYPIVLYGALELAGPIGAPELFHVSVPAAVESFAAAIGLMASREDSGAEASGEGPGDAAPDDESTDGIEDEMFGESLRFFIRIGASDVGGLVKGLGVTFGRAARIVSELEQEGFIGPPRSDGKREVRRSAIRFVELLDRSSSTPRSDGRSRRPRWTAVRRGRGRALEPHEVLGVETSATRAEIADAYRELAQLYHPDKVATMAPDFQELAEQRMKEINAAYNALCGGTETGKRAGRR